MTGSGAGRRPLRSVHVGVGGRGEHQLRNVIDHPAWRPVALVDTNARNLAQAAELAGLDGQACFDDLSRALAAVECDGVVVVSPSHFHAEHVRLALDAGRHVLVEKPFTQQLADAVELVERAERSELHVVVGQQYRYSASARAIRAAVERLGPVRYGTLIHHRRRPTVGAFTMADAMIVEMSVHHFDDLRAWVGADAESVTAHSFDPPWSGYRGGAVSCLLRFAGGAEIGYLGTFTSHSDSFDLRLECDDGVVGHDASGPYAIRDGVRVSLPDPDLPGADRCVLDQFTVAVEKGEASPISGRANLATLAMVDAARRSARTGLPVVCDERLPSRPGGSR